MLQVGKSHSSGISVIFFQSCFMTETQVLMSFQFFRVIFLEINFWKGASLFNRRGEEGVGGVGGSVGGFHFYVGGAPHGG